MIQRISKGRSFRGCVRYVRDKPGAELIGGSYGPSATSNEISSDLGEHGHRGGLTQKPVFHVALSLPPGEVLSHEQWNEAARLYLQSQGLSDSPFLVVRYTDTGCDHVHIVASRVDRSGNLISDSNDRHRGMGALREIERRFDLQPGRTKAVAQHQPLSQGEFRHAQRTGSPNLRAELQGVIRRAAAGNPGLDTFLTKLRAEGVAVSFNVTTSGTVRGVSFEYKAMTFRGSSLGRQFSWSGLQRQGVSYDASRHADLVAQRSPRSLAPPASSWSRASITDLARRLEQLRPSSGRSAIERARAALLSRGPSALAHAAGAAAILRDLTHPGRAILRRLPAGQALGAGLAFLGAFSSPTQGVLLAASLVGRAMASSPRPRQRPHAGEVRAVVKQFVAAALADCPSPSTFASRLAESGIGIHPSASGSLSLRVGTELLDARQLGFSSDRLATILGGPLVAARSHRPDAGPRVLSPESLERPTQGPDSLGSARDHSSGAQRDRNLPEHDRGPAHSNDPRPAGDLAGRASAPRLPSLDDGPTPPPFPHADRHGSPGARLESRDAVGREQRLPGLDASSPPAPAVGARSVDSGALPRFAGPGEGDARAAARAHEPLGRAVERHLAALNSNSFEIRIGTGRDARFHKDLSPNQVLEKLPDLARAQAQGLPVAVRSTHRSAAAFVGYVDLPALERARAAGFEPAAVLDAGGRLAVWVQHAPAPDAVRPFVHRAALLAYGQSPEAPARAFGPLAGFAQAGSQPTRLVQTSGASYTQAPILAAELTAARAERLAELGARLRAAGLPNLATFAAANRTRTADVEWARLALSRGLAQADVLSIIAAQGRHRASPPTHQLLYASRTLAAALSHSHAPKAAPLAYVISAAAGLSLKLVQAAAIALRIGAGLGR